MSLGLKYTDIEMMFIDKITECPHCHSVIDPRVINYFNICEKIKPRTRTKEDYLVTYFCKKCNTIFHARFVDFAGSYQCLEIYPQTPKTISFDERIKEISPNFCTIFEQACIAEAHNLTEIIGISYRKAFEVLVKDYAIFINSNVETETILKKSLYQVIETYFKESSLNTIFKKISWLGNDHSHTFNKHENYDVQDLKRFIKSCVSMIIAQLDIDELNSIESKNN